MTLLRIGFSVDETFADVESALRLYKTRLASGATVSQATAAGFAGRRQLDAVWDAIAWTPNFWTTLRPVEPGAVRRVGAAAARHGWRVVFVAQRRETEGDSVQRQTERWLSAQGFEAPTVIVTPNSPGVVAAALSLDYFVDTNPRNCLDVRSHSRTRPLMVVRHPDSYLQTIARRFGIVVVRSIDQAVDAMEQSRWIGAVGSLTRRLGTDSP